MSAPRRSALFEPVLAVALFLAGVVLAVWATERLLAGMVGLAAAMGLSTFAVGAVLSGFEAENVAVGLAAAVGDAPEIALGTVFGGAIFLVCVALGLGAVLYPLRVRLPRGALWTQVLAPVVAGLGLVGDTTPRWAGVVLLAAFAAGMAYLVLASRRHRFLETEEIDGAAEKRRPWPAALGLTVLGLVAVGIGGELVAEGATRIIAIFGVPAALVGMVVTPAAVEIEEVVRQAVPTRAGHPEVSAGNLVGTLLYFVLFNLGLIALLAPVRVDAQTRTLDWPFLVGATGLATLFLTRGRLGRLEGALLLLAYATYVALHLRTG